MKKFKYLAAAVILLTIAILCLISTLYARDKVDVVISLTLSLAFLLHGLGFLNLFLEDLL